MHVTGGSTRDDPSVPEFPHGVEDTATEVTEAGGRGIPVVCDHTDDLQVQALFEQIRSEMGRLDVLVANAWGGYMPIRSTTTGSHIRSPSSRWLDGTECSTPDCAPT